MFPEYIQSIQGVPKKLTFVWGGRSTLNFGLDSNIKGKMPHKPRPRQTWNNPDLWVYPKIEGAMAPQTKVNFLGHPVLQIISYVNI